MQEELQKAKIAVADAKESVRECEEILKRARQKFRHVVRALSLLERASKIESD